MSSRCVFTCQCCGQTLKRYSRYLDHLRGHTGERPFTCDCGKTYRRRQHLKRHQNSCSKMSPRDSGTQVAVGETVTTSEGKRTYPCPQCDAGPFRQKKMVWAHLAMVHRTELPVSRLHTHTLRIHLCCDKQRPMERKHACDQCVSRFPTQSKLLRHLKKHHGFKCHLCPIEDATVYGVEIPTPFDNLHALRRHLAVAHPKPALQCSICSRRFCRPSALTSHEETHTPCEERQRFPCPVCLSQAEDDGGGDKVEAAVVVPAFTARRNLYAHIRSAHGSQGFACSRPGCPVILSTKQKLAQHLERHRQHRQVGQTTRGPRRHCKKRSGQAGALKVTGAPAPDAAPDDDTSSTRGQLSCCSTETMKAAQRRRSKQKAVKLDYLYSDSDSASVLSQTDTIADLLMETWEEVAPSVQ